jgi:hypothetical protein
MYPARSGSGLGFQAMLSWALEAKEGKTKGSAVNAANKKSLNTIGRLLRHLLSIIPPFCNTGIMESWSNGVLEGMKLQ